MPTSRKQLFNLNLITINRYVHRYFLMPPNAGLKRILPLITPLHCFAFQAISLAALLTYVMRFLFQSKGKRKRLTNPSYPCSFKDCADKSRTPIFYSSCGLPLFYRAISSTDRSAAGR